MNVGRGADMPNREKLREDVIAKRRLAEHARRLADLVHQSELKRILNSEAERLERKAVELDQSLSAAA
jgi:hypothetical protein